MRSRIIVITLIGISLLAASCSAPWSSSSTPSKHTTSLVKPVGKKMTVPVDSRHALNVEIPNVGQLSGPAGAFSHSGSITIQPERAAFADSSILRASATGIDVAFEGTSLRHALTLAFDAGKKPSADAFPLVGHQSDDGQWNYLPAKLDSSGRIMVQTSSFSSNIPFWGSVNAFFHALANLMASGLGGRTPPLHCPYYSGPSWFHLNLQHSDMVHECLITNKTSDGQVVAEVQLKSNRGVTLEVDVPGNPAYVWVEGQTWAGRQQLARAFYYNPNGKVLLLPGKTMTIGYTRQADQPGTFQISSATPFAVLSTLTNDLINSVGGLVGLKKGPYTEAIGLQLALIQCGVRIDMYNYIPKISVSSLRAYMTCIASTVFAQFADKNNAFKIATQLGGSKLDAEALVALKQGFEIFGDIILLLPFAQLGIGSLIDVIHEWISNGQSSTVTWYMGPQGPTYGGTQTAQPPPGGITPPSGGSPPGANPTVTLAQGPAVSGGYRYAVTLSGFPAHASVSVECYDSVSPSGFYNFSMATDASGNAFTQSQCYSGDGPDHWVVANGITSNHVQWSGTTSPPPPPPSPPPLPTYSETTGGAAHTWTNYSNAGGVEGPTISAYDTVQIACKVTGFKVADGNTWWYRIASAPWSNVYYVSADAFYNNGATSGPLQGTPFVDPNVRDC